MALGACGDDEGSADADAAVEILDAMASCVDPADYQPAAGPFGDPSGFDRTGCEPGSLAGFDPTGLWYIEHAPHPRFGRGPVRFELSCSGGLGVVLGTIIGRLEPDVHALTADDLYWRTVDTFGENFEYVEAYTICRRDPDGRLFGRRATCYVEGGAEDCEQRDFVAFPFARLPGEPEADGFALVSEFRGGAQPWPAAFTADVRVRDGVAYVANGGDGLRLVDVSDPASPAALGHYPADSDSFNALHVVDAPTGIRYALVASAAAGALVIDVSDPAAPALAARFSPDGDPTHGVHTLFVETYAGSTRAYLADGYTEHVYVFDVGDPALAIPVGTFTLADPDWGVHALMVKQGRAYVSATRGGLVVADLWPDPDAAVVVGQYQKASPYAHWSWVTTTSGGRTVAAYGDEGWGSHLEIIDVDPASAQFMTRIGEIALRDQVSIHDFVAIGDEVWAAHYQDGLRRFDISDPTAPALVGHFNTWAPETAIGSIFEGAAELEVDVATGTVYLADTPRGLVILTATR